METAQSTTWGSNVILILIFGFVFGILVSSFVFISPVVCILFLIIGGAIILVDRKNLFIALGILSFGLGIIRYDIKDFHETNLPDATGVVVSEPEDRENTRRFVYEADNGEKVLVSVPLYTQVQYGDRVEVAGKLETPGVIVGENGERDFDYGKYLAKDDIYYTQSFSEVKVLESGHGNTIKATLLKLKNNFVSKAKEILAEPQASLLMGLIVSGREALPKDLLEEFRRAGVIHIVVLSGFNITIIAGFLKNLFRSNFASIFGIILFVIMTGAEASIVRAAIMALIAVGGKAFGREYDASRALVFAAFLMLLQNPKILVFDPSFQLSFLATLGLIYFMNPIEKRLLWIKHPKIREILSQTLATQLTVLPFLIYSMGDVSLVSIPANLLILLIVPYVMLTGFIATLVSYLSAIIAWPITYATHLLLSWILFISHSLGSLSFATLATPGIPAWVIFFFYLILILSVTFRSRWRSWIPRFANSN